LKTLAENDFGKLIGGKGYIRPTVFGMLFNDGMHLATGIRSNMENWRMGLFEKIPLRKCSVIETTNGHVEHTRQHPMPYFVINLIAAVAAYSFSEKKPAIKLYTTGAWTDGTVSSPHHQGIHHHCSKKASKIP